MTEDKRIRQYTTDLSELAEVVQEYQRTDGHAEITVKIQHGFITIIEDVRKRKPRKVDVEAEF